MILQAYKRTCFFDFLCIKIVSNNKSKNRILKTFSMEGYTTKHFRNLKVLIQDDHVSACSDTLWEDVCRRFFNEMSSDSIMKQGTYKIIFRADVQDTPCILKRYKNRGLAKRVKSIISASKAQQEFKAAVYVAQQGIPTAVPLFMAELHKKGFVAESLVALPLLRNTYELRDVFFKKETVSASERNRIAADFGRLTARIFHSGVFQNDYSLNNFLVSADAEDCRIYFIDFERVRIRAQISEAQKLELLAKLNRVGRFVSLTQRFRFLKNYLAADPGIAGGVKELAGKIQRKTIALLKRDLARGRLTSLYTHGSYDRIKLRGYTGLYKKGYNPDTIIQQVEKIPDSRLTVDVTMPCGDVENLLQAVQLQARDAEKIWSIISTLTIAGVPLELPHILVEGDKRGFIIMPAPALSTIGEVQIPAIITREFQEELSELEKFLLKFQ